MFSKFLVLKLSGYDMIYDDLYMMSKPQGKLYFSFHDPFK